MLGWLQIRAELQHQMMQDLVNRLTETCFKKCAGKSGVQLDSREQNCTAMCMDRYMDTMTVVNKAIVDRQERHP